MAGNNDRVRTELGGMVGRLESTNQDLQAVLGNTAEQLGSIETNLSGQVGTLPRSPRACRKPTS
jgi:hypothetical protein